MTTELNDRNQRIGQLLKASGDPVIRAVGRQLRLQAGGVGKKTANSLAKRMPDEEDEDRAAAMIEALADILNVDADPLAVGKALVELGDEDVELPEDDQPPSADAQGAVLGSKMIDDYKNRKLDVELSPEELGQKLEEHLEREVEEITPASGFKTETDPESVDERIEDAASTDRAGW